MAERPNSGITTNTPKNIVFGAGTIHKGLTYTEGTGWNFKESLLGATAGGVTLTITPEFLDIDIDGKLVPVKELYVKTGETATMEVNFAELTPEIMAMLVVGTDEASVEVADFNELKTKARIEVDDYIENLAYVGSYLDGTEVIVIFKNAVCTSGMTLGGTNKQNSTVTATFTCVADLDGTHDTLPITIYHPVRA